MHEDRNASSLESLYIKIDANTVEGAPEAPFGEKRLKNRSNSRLGSLAGCWTKGDESV
jgi:hypothetical protein